MGSGSSKARRRFYWYPFHDRTILGRSAPLSYKVSVVGRAWRLRPRNKVCPVSLQPITKPYFRYVGENEPHVVYYYNLEPLLQWLYASDKFVEVYTQTPFTRLEVLRLEWLRRRHFPNLGGGLSLTDIAFNEPLRAERKREREEQRQREGRMEAFRTRMVDMRDIMRTVTTTATIELACTTRLNTATINWILLLTGLNLPPAERVTMITELIAELDSLPAAITINVESVRRASLVLLGKLQSLLLPPPPSVPAPAVPPPAHPTLDGGGGTNLVLVGDDHTDTIAINGTGGGRVPSSERIEMRVAVEDLLFIHDGDEENRVNGIFNDEDIDDDEREQDEEAEDEPEEGGGVGGTDEEHEDSVNVRGPVEPLVLSLRVLPPVPHPADGPQPSLQGTPPT